MKLLKNAMLPLAVIGALALGANAQTEMEHNHTKPDVRDEMILSGHVKKLLTGENLISIHGDHGADFDVATDTIGSLGAGRMGLQKIEPGEDIDARMHPGVLAVSPASNGRIWILVDDKKFARVLPSDINDHLFDTDRVTVRYSDGCEKDDVSLADLLIEQNKLIAPGR